MPPVFAKLNLKDQDQILVLNAPQSFESSLSELGAVSIARTVGGASDVAFSLAFVTTQEQLDALARAIAPKACGDVIVWFAYPKGSSKRYKCEINRDSGWGVLGELGFEAVRQVAIDEDWSALRFRRVEFIKKMNRDRRRAITKQGKARVAKK